MEKWGIGISEYWKEWVNGGLADWREMGRGHSEGSMKEGSRVYGEIRGGKIGEQGGGAIV